MGWFGKKSRARLKKVGRVVAAYYTGGASEAYYAKYQAAEKTRRAAAARAKQIRNQPLPSFDFAPASDYQQQAPPGGGFGGGGFRGGGFGGGGVKPWYLR